MAPSREVTARSELHALLGEGAQFNGKLTFSGRVRIDGTFKGEVHSDGVLILCLPSCDPLLQNCPGALEACYPSVDGSSFQCYPDYSGETGSYGDPCAYTNVCDPGLFCTFASIVPGCASDLCCSEFCDLTDPNPDATCTGQAEGQSCIPWFEEGTAPPGAESVGYCGIPA